MRGLEFFELLGSLQFEVNELAKKTYADEKKQKAVNDFNNRINILCELFRKKKDAPITNNDIKLFVHHMNFAHSNFSKLKLQENAGAVAEDTMKRLERKLMDVESVIARLDATKNMTLTEAIDNTDVLTVELGKKAGVIGNVSSERKLITVPNSKGEEVQGFFTKDKTLFDVDHDRKITAIIDEALSKNPTDETLKDFCDRVKKHPYGADAIFDCMIGADITGFADEDLYLENIYNPEALLTNDLIDHEYMLEHFGAKDGIGELLLTIAKEFPIKQVNDVRQQHLQYGSENKIGIQAKAGSSIAGRTVAFSNAANILGIPELVPTSVPMTVTEDGKEVQGVFMERAKGQAIPNNIEEMAFTDFMLIDNISLDGEVLQQLADLQVLDYICQNVDRHLANLTYTINKDGMITNIQGIDNDLSFGTVKLEPNERVQHGTALHNITVMSKNMATRIEMIQPEAFRAAIENTGLAKEEIDASVARLVEVKEYLANNKNQEKMDNPGNRFVTGKVRVLEKNDWKNVKLGQLKNLPGMGKKQTNIFMRASEMIDLALKKRAEYYKGQKKTYINARDQALKYQENHELQFVKSNRVDQLSDKELLANNKHLKDLLAALTGAESDANKDMPLYAEMKAALEKAVLANTALVMEVKNASLLQQMDGALNEQAKLDAEILIDQKRNDYENSLRELIEATNDYLDIYTVASRNSADIKAHFDVANRISDFTVNHEAIFHTADMQNREMRLGAVYVQLAHEEMQFDYLVDTLANKIVEKLPDVNKDQAIESIHKNQILKEILAADKSGNYNAIYNKTKENPDSLYAQYTEKLLGFKQSELKDPVHKALMAKVAADMGYELIQEEPKEVLCKNDDRFKELIAIQSKKLAIATSMIESQRVKGAICPDTMALAFAERAVFLRLRIMEDRVSTDKIMDKLDRYVNHTDYEAEIERIKVDPAFARVMSRMPRGKVDEKTINKLFDKYAVEVAKAVPAQPQNGAEQAQNEAQNVQPQL